MTRQEATEILSRPFAMKNAPDEVLKSHEMAIKALELLGTLTDRPCSVCKHRKEKGCSEWSCVFDEYIGG